MPFEHVSRLLAMGPGQVHTACPRRGVRGPAWRSPARSGSQWSAGRRYGSTWHVVGVMSLCLLTGCAAAYTPPPLTMQHPAHPEAMAAPAPPPSTTLAYGPSDIPAPQPASSLAHHEMPQDMQHAMQDAQPSPQHRQPSGAGERRAQHVGHGAQPSAQENPSAVVGEGKVIAVVLEQDQIVVDHKAIPGVMGAITMGYRVKPPALLAGVKTGAMIRFTLDPQQQVIVKIEQMHE